MVSYGPPPPVHVVAALAAAAAVLVLHRLQPVHSRWWVAGIGAVTAGLAALLVGLFVNDWYWDAGDCTYTEPEGWTDCGYEAAFSLPGFMVVLVVGGALLAAGAPAWLALFPAGARVAFAVAPLALFPVMLLTDPGMQQHPLGWLWGTSIVLAAFAVPFAIDAILERIQARRQNRSH